MCKNVALEAGPLAGLQKLVKINQKYNYNITLRIHELEPGHKPEFYNSDAKKIGRADVLKSEPVVKTFNFARTKHNMAWTQ